MKRPFGMVSMSKPESKPKAEFDPMSLKWPRIEKAKPRSTQENVMTPPPDFDADKPVGERLLNVCVILGNILRRMREEPRDLASDAQCLKEALFIASPLQAWVVRGDTHFHGLPALVLASRGDDKAFWFGLPNTVGVNDPRCFTGHIRRFTAARMVGNNWDATNLIMALRAAFEHAAERSSSPFREVNL